MALCILSVFGCVAFGKLVTAAWQCFAAAAAARIGRCVLDRLMAVFHHELLMQPCDFAGLCVVYEGIPMCSIT